MSRKKHFMFVLTGRFSKPLEDRMSSTPAFHVFVCPSPSEGEK
jgi:hypothetical protein